MKEYIRNRLHESFGLDSFRLPTDIDLSEDEIKKIKSINWSDLKIDDLGGEGNVAHLAVEFPFQTKASRGVVVDIQVIKNIIYQVHIQLTKELQGLGLSYKIYKALIKDLGHLYSGKGRRLNPIVNKIWDKLKKDSDFSCKSGGMGDICASKNNPNKDELLNFVG